MQTHLLLSLVCWLLLQVHLCSLLMHWCCCYFILNSCCMISCNFLDVYWDCIAFYCCLVNLYFNFIDGCCGFIDCYCKFISFHRHFIDFYCHRIECVTCSSISVMISLLIIAISLIFIATSSFFIAGSLIDIATSGFYDYFTDAYSYCIDFTAISSIRIAVALTFTSAHRFSLRFRAFSLLCHRSLSICQRFLSKFHWCPCQFYEFALLLSWCLFLSRVCLLLVHLLHFDVIFVYCYFIDFDYLLFRCSVRMQLPADSFRFRQASQTFPNLSFSFRFIFCQFWMNLAQSSRRWIIMSIGLHRSRWFWLQYRRFPLLFHWLLLVFHRRLMRFH